MSLLDDLAVKYGADKTPKLKHHYTDVYRMLFGSDDIGPGVYSVRKVCEIGTAEGASLFMWRDYFPNATIYGGEIDQKRVDLMKNQDRIQVFKCDQFNKQDIKNLIDKTGSDIDLFIDDGSHHPTHQLFTCTWIMPLLNKEAIYVIEDVDDVSADNIFGHLIACGYSVQMVRVGLRHDDRLIIVRHKEGNFKYE